MSCPKRTDALQQRLDYKRAPMRMQFEYVIAGKRLRRRKKQRDATVDCFAAIGGAELQQRCIARLRHDTKQTQRNLFYQRARNTDDRYAAAASRRAASNDGIGGAEISDDGVSGNCSSTSAD